MSNNEYAACIFMIDGKSENPEYFAERVADYLKYKLIGSIIAKDTKIFKSKEQINKPLNTAMDMGMDALVVPNIGELGKSLSGALGSVRDIMLTMINHPIKKHRWIHFADEHVILPCASSYYNDTVGFLSVLCDFDRAVVSKRVKAGQKAAKEQGRLLGRPKKIY